jgi:hypothetical protein
MTVALSVTSLYTRLKKRQTANPKHVDTLIIYQKINTVLTRQFVVVPNSAYYLRHVLPSVLSEFVNSAAPIGQISVKFDAGDFYEKIIEKNPNLFTT